MNERKSILITGAAKGIGKATAELFLEKDWRVILLDKNSSELRAAFSENDDRTLLLEADVSDCRTLKNHYPAITKFCDSKLDVLFNNAGIIHVGAFDEVELEKQHATIDVNLKGVLNVTHNMLPLLKASEGSRLISMASASAIYGNPEITVYAATKAAIQSLTEGWSIAFEKYGIECCDIAPIYVSTEMVTDNYGKYRRMDEKDVKLRPEDVAATVWRSLNSKKLHWYVGMDTRIFAGISRFLPQRTARYLTKKVLGF